MADDHSDDCACGIPEDAIVTNVLTVIEYVLPNGELWCADFSHDSADEQLDMGKMLEMCEWLKASRNAPLLADMVASLLYEDE